MEIFENNSFFRKLGFTRDRSFILNVDAQTFRNCFTDNISDELNFFGLSKHEKLFHGQIRTRSFNISRPMKYFNQSNFVTTKGTYESIDSRIKVHIIGYVPITLFLLLCLMHISIISAFFALLINLENTPIIVFVFLTGFYIFFGTSTYFNFRNEVRVMVSDIEREMGFWIARTNTLHQNV